jgi:thiol-disulfide isomerase/thioredoxin
MAAVCFLRSSMTLLACSAEVLMGVRFFLTLIQGTDFLGATFLYIRMKPVAYRAMVIVLVLTVVFPGIAAGQSVVDLRGSAAEELAKARGKVLVLVFVRTDCPVSNRYAPLIQKLSKQYGENASFRLVFPDKSESPEKIRNFLQEYKYELSAIRDVDHALVKATQAKVTPEAAVFDAHGTLAYHGRIDNLYERIGQARRAATTHELADAIEAARQGKNPAVPSADGVGCFIADME